eukprot:6299152-Pyramimonas_sp.AAC.1
MQRSGKFGEAYHTFGDYDDWCQIVQAVLDQVGDLISGAVANPETVARAAQQPDPGGRRPPDECYYDQGRSGLGGEGFSPSKSHHPGHTKGDFGNYNGNECVPVECQGAQVRPERPRQGTDPAQPLDLPRTTGLHDPDADPFLELDDELDPRQLAVQERKQLMSAAGNVEEPASPCGQAGDAA